MIDPGPPLALLTGAVGIVRRTDDHVVYQKRSNRYAVRNKDKRWVNGDDKVRILLALWSPYLSPEPFYWGVCPFPASRLPWRLDDVGRTGSLGDGELDGVRRGLPTLNRGLIAGMPHTFAQSHHINAHGRC